MQIKKVTAYPLRYQEPNDRLNFRHVTLAKIETDNGVYAGFRRAVLARTLEQVLASALPASIAEPIAETSSTWKSSEVVALPPAKKLEP